MTILVLDNIRSVHNVGAMFRTAEAAGVDEILLVGITPAPIDRFGRVRRDLAKAAVGAENMVSWQHFMDPDHAIQYLQANDYYIVVLEKNNASRDYKTIPTPSPLTLVVGNENTGVGELWVSAAKHIVHIPMLGNKESLNVSTACGIALYRLLDL